MNCYMGQDTEKPAESTKQPKPQKGLVFVDSLNSILNSLTPLTETVIGAASAKGWQEREIAAQERMFNMQAPIVTIPGTNTGISTQQLLIISGIALGGMLIFKKKRRHR